MMDLRIAFALAGWSLMTHSSAEWSVGAYAFGSSGVVFRSSAQAAVPQTTAAFAAEESSRSKVSESEAAEQGRRLQPVPKTLVPREELPLSVKGRHVLGQSGQRIRLFCVNWYGAQLRQRVQNGLNKQPLSAIVARIAELGFNCVRLPFSLELMLETSYRLVPEAQTRLAANPELQELSPAAVFDRVVEALTATRLLVIPNVHSSKAGWCCSIVDGEGLWWTPEYPEEAWLGVLRRMAQQYKGNAYVAAYDIRNEIRWAHGLMPTWGGGERSTDWAEAATRGALAVLNETEEVMIIISGLRFGKFLCDVRRRPVHKLPQLQGRTLYTSHDYPWYHLGSPWKYIYEAPAIALSLLSAGALTTLAAQRWCKARQSRLLARCSGRCPICELGAAVLLTGFTLLWVPFGAGWLTTSCNQDGGLDGFIWIGAATASGLLSLLLWLRVAVADKYGAYAGLWRRRRDARALPPQAIGRSDEASSGVEVGRAGNGWRPSPEEHHGEVAAREMKAPRVKAQRVPLLLRVEVLLAALAPILLLATAMGWNHVGHYSFFAAELDRRWAIDDAPDADAFPVWVSEFGTNSDTDWWKNILRYLGERDLDWGYWPLNGEKRTGEEESYGILSEDMVSIRHPWMLEQLQQLIRSSMPEEQGGRETGQTRVI